MSDEITGRLIAANVRIQALEGQARNLQALLAVAEERGEHYREEMKRLALEAERLARRNAVLVTEIEGTTESKRPDDFILLGSDRRELMFSVSGSRKRRRMNISLCASDEFPPTILEFHQPTVVMQISDWMRNASSWMSGGHRDAKSK